MFIHRSAEEEQSVASEESGIVEAESLEAPAVAEAEPSPRVHMTPADAQITRIEAEAIEKQMQRLAKQKKQASQVSCTTLQGERVTIPNKHSTIPYFPLFTCFEVFICSEGAVFFTRHLSPGRIILIWPASL